MLSEGQVNLPDGGSVAWCEWGDAQGHPVVLLHGTPGSRLFLADPTSGSPPGLRVLTFDRPGYGRSSPPALPSVYGVAAIIGRLADDRGFERFPVVGFSGGVPFALACGAVLNDRVSCIAAVSGQGPIDELTDAYAALSDAELEMVSEIRRDPAVATDLLWEHGQWYPDTPLRMFDHAPATGDESVLNDPVIRANLVASDLEGRVRVRPGSSPTGSQRLCRGASDLPTSQCTSTSGSAGSIRAGLRSMRPSWNGAFRLARSTSTPTQATG